MNGLDVSVILPTYNEADNLPVLVPRVCRALRDAGLQGEVIVVDDDSPDRTAQVAQELGRQLPVRVIVRRGQRGLATAALAGFAASQATVVVVMDADGSHAPEKLPELVGPVIQGTADIVVASRWRAGGGVRNWPWYRYVASRLAATLACGLTQMTDPTAGFMAARRALVAGLDLEPVGWKIVLEVVVKAPAARLLEIPIVFFDRERGQSKLGWGAQYDYLRHLLRLYRHRRA